MFGDPIDNPKQWDCCKLCDIGTLKNGMNFDKKNCGYKIKFLGVGNFKNGILIDNENKLDEIYLTNSPNEDYLLKNKDIVFVRSNGSKELVGRTTLIKNMNVEITFSGFCIRFRNKSQKLNEIYLINLFNIPSYFINLKKNNRGANINNINQQMLSRLIIPIPPIELQNKFAQIVEQIDKQKFVNMNLSQIIGKMSILC